MAKEKKLTLSVGERIYFINELNQFKGNMEGLASVLEDVKKIALTDKERETIEYKVTQGTDGKAFINWKPEKLEDKEMELNKFTIDYIMKGITEKDAKGEFTSMDVGVIELSTKLKAL